MARHLLRTIAEFLKPLGYATAQFGKNHLVDPSIGGLLKNLGYNTAQFGKNHVGDRNETLPRSMASTNSSATCIT